MRRENRRPLQEFRQHFPFSRVPVEAGFVIVVIIINVIIVLFCSHVPMTTYQKYVDNTYSLLLYSNALVKKKCFHLHLCHHHHHHHHYLCPHNQDNTTFHHQGGKQPGGKPRVRDDQQLQQQRQGEHCWQRQFKVVRVMMVVMGMVSIFILE